MTDEVKTELNTKECGSCGHKWIAHEHYDEQFNSRLHHPCGMEDCQCDDFEVTFNALTTEQTRTLEEQLVRDVMDHASAIVDDSVEMRFDFHAGVITPEEAYRLINPSIPQLSIHTAPEEEDNVNHPSHYTSYKGIEVIQLTRQMNFNRGNAVKYIARAGLKDPDKEIEDLQKAAWYIQDEIQWLQDLASGKYDE